MNSSDRETTLTKARVIVPPVNRREALMTFGSTAVGVAGLTEPNAAELPAHENTAADLCEKACADTMASCSKHVGHCTQHLADGHKEYAKCLEMCVGCLETTGACIGTCYGPMGVNVAEACAEACDLCAAECERITSDVSLKAHARLCRDCATACREFVKSRA